MDWALFDQEGAIRQRFLELDDQAEEVRDVIGELDKDGFLDLYDTSWIYHENALEGVVVTSPEIRSAIDNRVVSDVSLLPTYRDIKAQKQCIDMIRDKAQSKRFTMSVEFLEQLHLLLAPTEDSVTRWRKDVPIHRTYFHEILQPGLIREGLDEVIASMKGRHRDMHPIELAANIHHRFMKVFPFTTHSGFLGRLVLNFILIRHDYLPAVIHASDRQRYYQALRDSDAEFRTFLCETMENAFDNTIKHFHGRHVPTKTTGVSQPAAG